MFCADPLLTLIALVPFPILLIATYYFKESVNKSFHRVRNAVAHLNAFVQEHITGMSVVQAFAAEDREMEKFKNINKEHRNANKRSNSVTGDLSQIAAPFEAPYRHSRQNE